MKSRLPLLGAIAMGCVLALGAIGAASGGVAAGDPDVWWVAAAGRESGWGMPLQTNFFSFTAPEHPWVFHEWLAGPIYASGASAFGTIFFAFVALVGLLSQAGAAIAGALQGERKEDAAGLLLALVWAVTVGFHGMSARVTVVVRVLPIAVALLAFGRKFNWRHGAACVALTFLWANVHGSFPLAFVLLAAGGLEGHRRARWTTAALSVLASLLTPHGLRVHQLALGYVFGDSSTLDVVHDHLVEFRPIWEHIDAAGALGRLALLAIALLALGSLRRWPGRAGVVLLMTVLTIRHQRHLALAILLAVPLLRPALARWIPELRIDRKAVAIFALGPAFVLGVAMLVMTPAPQAIGDPGFTELVDRLPSGARVFVPMRFGGRVIWRRFPEVRPFYDSRNDCYPAEVAREGFELPSTENAESTLVDRNVTHVLIQEHHPLRVSWPVVARREGWVLYARPAATLSP